MPDTIEAEVLEIDGSPAPPPSRDAQTPPQRGGADAWRAALQGQIFRLDKRWWPLWVFLGIVAVAILAVIGVFVVAFIVVAKILGGILRLLGLGGGSAARPGASILIRRGP
ncbi:hypothetical protein [Haloferula sp. BvORR071]|uniref:hypothetical protein n=1 Tax=Haloferula sp. BvORR071 TaxID=1396141 RepID=UPI00055351BF|nr:hypothetical protein [Haloferula sp. BvORR071]